MITLFIKACGHSCETPFEPCCMCGDAQHACCDTRVSFQRGEYIRRVPWLIRRFAWLVSVGKV